MKHGVAGNGMWVLVLTVIFIFGQVWFHLVEGLLSKIKSLLGRNKKAPNWHTFDKTDEENSVSYGGPKQERRR